MRRVTTLAPNGLPARIVLAALVAAGILYGNLSPLIVSGLAQGESFTSATAGYVFSINMYGTALGGMAIVFLIRRLNWRPSVAALSLLLIGADLWSAWLNDPTTLSTVRFLHGLAGGALIGVVSSVIARTTSPERTFALAMGIQLGLGGVGTAVLAPFVLDVGVDVIWVCLAGFTTLGLIMLPMLDAYPVRAPELTTGSTGRAPWWAIAMGCAALFVYQAGEMAAFTYTIEIGLDHRLEADFIGGAVATGLGIGGPAALLVAWWSIRSGRLLPSFIGALLTASTVAMFFWPHAAAYLFANVGFGIFFSLTLPYLMGLVAEMDNTGQTAALGGFVNSLGLATGPALAATFLGDNHFERVVLLAVVALTMSALLVVSPARLLDRRNRHGPVVW